jgi:hypothetical protein
LRVEFAEVARFLIQNEGAVADAANLLDEVADLLKHFAQLSVAALDKDDFVPGIVALANLADAGRRGADFVRTRLAALDGDASAELVKLGLGGNAGDLDEIGLLHSRGGAGEAVGELTVVGDQQQPLAHVVQAADGVEALPHLVEELHHRGPAFGVLDGGHEASGLVEDEVPQPLRAL